MPQRHVEAARRIFEHLAKTIDAPFSVRLWDGTTIPLGRDAAGGPCIAIARPGVLGALFRRPTLDHLFRRYVGGDLQIDGDLLAFVDAARRRKKETRIGFADLRKDFPWTKALPLLLARDSAARISHHFQGATRPSDTEEARTKTSSSFITMRATSSTRSFSTRRWSIHARTSATGPTRWSRRNGTSST